MSLKFVDGMDAYSGAGDIDRRWNDVPNPGDVSYLPTGGRFGGGAIKLSTTEGNLLTVVPKHQTLIFGWSFNIDSFGSTVQFIARTQLAGAGHIGIKLNTDGTLKVVRADGINRQWGSSLTTLLAASDKAMFTDTWHFVEVRVVHDDSVGEVQVWVDEEKWVDLTGIDTLGGSSTTKLANDVVLGYNGVGNANNQRVDDVYVITPDGAGQNNSRLGDIRIETLLPDADTTQADFTPKSGGDNYEEVDDAGLDLDTSYNSSDVLGARDLFQFTDIADTPDQIFALVASIAARKETAGTRRLASVLKSNGQVETGGVNEADRVLTQEYLYRQFIHPLDPDGDVAWTKAAVDAVEAGYEIAQ